MSEPRIKPRLKDVRSCGFLSLEKEIECRAEHPSELKLKELIKARDDLNKLIGEVRFYHWFLEKAKKGKQR